MYVWCGVCQCGVNLGVLWVGLKSDAGAVGACGGLLDRKQGFEGSGWCTGCSEVCSVQKVMTIDDDDERKNKKIKKIKK